MHGNVILDHLSTTDWDVISLETHEWHAVFGTCCELDRQTKHIFWWTMEGFIYWGRYTFMSTIFELSDVAGFISTYLLENGSTLHIFVVVDAHSENLWIDFSGKNMKTQVWSAHVSQIELGISPGNLGVVCTKGDKYRLLDESEHVFGISGTGCCCSVLLLWYVVPMGWGTNIWPTLIVWDEFCLWYRD